MTMKQQERKARQERLDAARRETIAVVESGCCPNCGSGLRRNLALAGWWQCEQYGADTHRARPSEPQCSWQGFTA